MKFAFALVLLAAVITCFAAPNSATAGGFGYGAPGYGYGGYYSWANQHIHLDRQIPYFALHPPVYYSYPVPRTYGYSPFAYGPCVKTPDGPMPPEMISNPSVPQRVPSAPCIDCEVSTRRPAPLVVLNPYVEQGASVAKVSAGR